MIRQKIGISVVNGYVCEKRIYLKWIRHIKQQGCTRIHSGVAWLGLVQKGLKKRVREG